MLELKLEPEVKPKNRIVVVDIHEKTAAEKKSGRIGWLARTLQHKLDDKHSKLKINVIEKAITPGDIILPGDIGIERKEARDLIGSIMDGRVFEQCRRLAQSYETSYLLIEGSPYKVIYSGYSKLKEVALMGALISLGHVVKLIYTENKSSTVSMLATMTAREFKEKTKVEFNLRANRKALNDKEHALNVLVGFPMLGVHFAEKLLEHYGSIMKTMYAIRTWKEEDMFPVKGVSTKKLTVWKKILEVKWNE